ncbi:MAG: xanthine dehydrogenase family protein molybdopterin-binding subunit, partial [Alphaproteobacteria bacterium]
MQKFGISQPVRRREDLRFLTGHGRYVDDIAPRDALWGVFFRSPVAHARITGLDVSAARAVPGVRAVLTAEDLVDAGVDLAMPAVLVRNRDGSRAAAPVRPALAVDRVRFVGEAVALVVATSHEAALDGLEAIVFDHEDLPVHLDLAPGGESLHPEAPDNVAFDWEIGDAAAVDRAISRGAHVVRLAVDDNRIIANAVEPRSAVATWDGERLHFSVSGQGVWGIRDALAKGLGLPAGKVHVTTPDVGGGFGMKATMYPEYLVLAEAARRLGASVRWTASRTESMLADNAGRDLVSTAELVFDDDFRLMAYRVQHDCNLGAYNGHLGQVIQTELGAKVLTGVYDIPAVHARVRGIYTNTTQVDAYRGAGRPEAIYVLERAMDHAARVLGVDPWELRQRNVIRPEALPYTNVAGETYDVGDFPRMLDRAMAEADVAGFGARRSASSARGRLRGIGVSFYIEAILGDPTEGATVEFTEDGVDLYVGTQSNGQGHETVFAQILSDLSGIPFERIRIIQGDSDRIAKGGGTGGSRSVTVQGTATKAVVETTVEAFSAFLRDELGAPEVTFEDGTFRPGNSNRAMTMLEVAALARARGRTDLLRQQATIRLDGRSFPNGVHVCEVEIDVETGELDVVRYTAVDDFGTLMNPLLVEGQVHGGVAQGIGQAVSERVVYDDTGQLLTATFMDYAVPRAEDLCFIRFVSEPVPTRTNPLGMKGCGEAGTVGALAAVANAVRDALADFGGENVDMPFTPVRLWSMIHGHPVPGARARPMP